VSCTCREGGMGELGCNFSPLSLSRAFIGQGLISNQDTSFRSHHASSFPEAKPISSPSPHASRLNSNSHSHSHSHSNTSTTTIRRADWVS